MVAVLENRTLTLQRPVLTICSTPQPMFVAAGQKPASTASSKARCSAAGTQSAKILLSAHTFAISCHQHSRGAVSSLLLGAGSVAIRALLSTVQWPVPPSFNSTLDRNLVPAVQGHKTLHQRQIPPQIRPHCRRQRLSQLRPHCRCQRPSQLPPRRRRQHPSQLCPRRRHQPPTHQVALVMALVAVDPETDRINQSAREYQRTVAKT